MEVFLFLPSVLSIIRQWTWYIIKKKKQLKWENMSFKISYWMKLGVYELRIRKRIYLTLGVIFISLTAIITTNINHHIVENLIFFQFFMGMVTVFLVVFFLERSILSRLIQLSREIKAIGESYDLAKRLRFAHMDNEFGVVAREINNMLQNIQDSHSMIRASEEKYRTLIEQAIDGIFIVDEKGNYLEVNSSGCELVGYTKTELIQMNVIDLIPEENKKTEINDFKRLVEGHSLFKELCILRKDGTLVPVELSAKKLSNGNLMAIVRDIAERKKAEDDLRESEKRFRLIASNFPDGFIIIHDENYRYLMIEGMGMEKAAICKEHLGKTIYETLPQEKCKEMEPHLQAAFNGNQSSFEITLNDQTFLNTVVPFHSKEKVYTIMRVVQNITERKLMESELIKADKLEAIGLLAGGIAHDYNNLLTIMLGNVTLAKKYKDINKIYEKLDSIEKVTLQAKDLTKQLFVFAKGGAPLKKTLCIKNLLKDNVNMALSGSNVSCKLSLDQNLYPVKIDEGQFSQVISNIIINAVQAMPEEGNLWVTAENINMKNEKRSHFIPLGDGKYVKISIKDEGIGISRGDLHKVFDPFFTTKTGGTGLGLATSYSIIKKHDGFIKVESEEGRGSSFYIYLPISRDSAFNRDDEAVIYGSGRILFMDDEEGIRTLAGEMLSTLGYEHEFALCGEEVVEKYLFAKDTGNPFDAVIMDLTIPGGMGGKNAVKHLLTIDSTAKVIVSSGYSNDPVMANYRQYGFKGIIAKPYKIEEFSRVLHQTIYNDKQDKGTVPLSCFG